MENKPVAPRKLYAKRESNPPRHWVVRDLNTNEKVDRDKYSNDLKEKYSAPEYELTFDLT